jgi:hypothetical protein
MEIEGFFETDNIYIALWKKTSKGPSPNWVCLPYLLTKQVTNEVVHHLDERGQNNSSITKQMI